MHAILLNFEITNSGDGRNRGRISSRWVTIHHPPRIATIVTALMKVLLPRPGAPYWSTACCFRREKIPRFMGAAHPLLRRG